MVAELLERIGRRKHVLNLNTAEQHDVMNSWQSVGSWGWRVL